MKYLLALAIGILACAAIAQTGGQAHDSVIKYVDDANKACPTKISDALTQTSVALTGSDLTFEWTVEHDKAFGQIKDKSELVRGAKIAELSMCEPSENQYVYLIKVAKVDLVFNLTNKAGTDTVTIRIARSDLD